MESKEIKKIISSSKNVAIFGHAVPDLDCFGAMYGAKFLCEQFGAKAHIFSTASKDLFLFKIFDYNKIETDFDESKFDLVLIVDANEFSRLDSAFRDKVQRHKNVLVIDHHEQSRVESGCKFYVHSEFCAASLIITDLLYEYKIKISKEVGEFLFAGIVGDTGRFLHTNTDKHTFEMVTKLMDLGIDIQKIYDATYRSKTLKQVNVQKFLYDNMNIVNNHACYIVVSNKDLKKLDARFEDVKLFMDDLNQINEFDVVMVAYELDKDEYKVSCRSKNGFEVNKVAKKQGGGGHKMAAGFNLSGNKKLVAGKLKNICEEI